MTYDCAHCGHPAEDHATGLCLHTLECLCKGTRYDDEGAVHGPQGTQDPQDRASNTEK